MFHWTLNQVYNNKHFEIVTKKELLFLRIVSYGQAFVWNGFALKNLRNGSNGCSLKNMITVFSCINNEYLTSVCYSNNQRALKLKTCLLIEFTNFPFSVKTWTSSSSQTHKLSNLSTASPIGQCRLPGPSVPTLHRNSFWRCWSWKQRTCLYDAKQNSGIYRNSERLRIVVLLYRQRRGP